MPTVLAGLDHRGIGQPIISYLIASCQVSITRYQITNNTDSDLMLADGKCELVIDTLGLSATVNWNAIWQASEAILAMCLRQQRAGTSNVAGKKFQ